MDAALKELAKLEKLTADGKAKSPPIDQTLDALLATLRAERERVQSGNGSPETLEGLATNVESLKKDLDDRQKEIYNSISRYGKALDKACPP
jgi:protein SFI1